MKRYLPWVVILLVLVLLASSWRRPQSVPGDFNFKKFGELPVLASGRLKPLDTVARNALVILRGRQSLSLEDGKTLTATQWLADVMFNAPKANGYPSFAIHNPEVLGLFGWLQGDRKYFTYDELEPFFEKIDFEGDQAQGVEPAQRTPYQNAILNLRNSLIVYRQLQQSLRPGETRSFAVEVEAYGQFVSLALEAIKQGDHAEPSQKKGLGIFGKLTQRYQHLAQTSSIRPVPPLDADARQRGEWLSIGASLAGTLAEGGVNPTVKAYAAMGDAYRANLPEVFEREVNALASSMAAHETEAVNRSSFECLFNRIAPFYQSMVLYVLVFLLVCGSWLGWSRSLNRSALYVAWIALVLHTFGLVARMYLQGRPPVTNLYSSAVFVGWGTVVIGLIVERTFRDGISLACSAVIGYITLVIAHHLAGSGDTLEMLRAVLDTNLWLATHVVSITLGYSAMFLAGMLAMSYVIRGVFTRSLTRGRAEVLARMTYGVICFALLFSLVGTVLGGIWADQAWGRFWGWDPKENGALLIVLWCAIILHALKWGYIRQRGLMVLALFGNVVTSFSWFGVNMLGVGLHSYGFMDKAFPWLIAFGGSHLVLMALAAIPVDRWRSDPLKSDGALRVVDCLK